MENNEMNVQNNETIEPVVKQKSNKGLIVLIIILILMVLGLSGYLVYDKFIEKDTAPKTVEKKDNNSSTTDNTNKTDDTKIDSNTNNQSTTQTAETDADIVKRLFINNYLLKPESEKLVDYRINEIKVLSGTEKQQIVNMGYKDTDILAYVTYSVKVNDINTSNWSAGNGTDGADNWIVDKTACVAVRDGELISSGTGW